MCFAPNTTKICYICAGTLKAGYAGSMYPAAFVPCRVQMSTTAGPSPVEQHSVYTPAWEYNWAAQQFHNSNLMSPCVNGVVEDWEAMRCVWQHAFDQLKVSC